MGKIHRLREGGKLPAVAPKPPRPVVQRKRKRAPFIIAKKKLTQGPPKPIAPPAPIEGGVGILELRDHHCRAVTGRGADGLARYCGNQKATEFIFRAKAIRSSYCEGHARVYYNADYR